MRDMLRTFPSPFLFLLVLIVVAFAPSVRVVILVLLRPPSPWPRRDTCKPPLPRHRGHRLGAQATIVLLPAFPGLCPRAHRSSLYRALGHLPVSAVHLHGRPSALMLNTHTDCRLAAEAGPAAYAGCWAGLVPFRLT